MASTTMQPQWGQLRPVRWGEALSDAVRHAHIGGMPAISEAARAVVGPMIGGSSTFTRLYELEAPPDDGAPAFRAWITVTVIGADPGAWGLTDDVVPIGLRPADELRQLLTEGVESHNTDGETPTSSYARSGAHRHQSLAA